MAGARRVRHPVVVSLFWRVVAINAGGLVVAALVLALSPATVSPTLTVAEGAVLTVGTLALIAVNIVLLRRVFEPLERLAAVMRRHRSARTGPQGRARAAGGRGGGRLPLVQRDARPARRRSDGPAGGAR